MRKDIKTIGDLIRYHRKRQVPVMRQGDMAFNLEMTKKNINRIEKNHIVPRYDVAIKILKHLGVDTKHPLMEGW